MVPAWVIVETPHPTPTTQTARATHPASSFCLDGPSARFPPPWSVDDPDMKLGQDCSIVRDGNGQALAYVYFEDEPGERSAAKLRGIAANIAELPGLLGR